MKKSKLSFFLISCFLLFCSCEEKSLHLTEVPTRDDKGNIHILISTPSENKNFVEFDFVNQRFNSTKKNNSLQNIAHTGYLAGKNTLQQAIVLGQKAKIGSLIKALPIGIVSFGSENQQLDWHIYADVNSEICDLEDLMLNHFQLKEMLQSKLKLLEADEKSKVIWYDEAFLEFKINQIL
jgi:hypothetical protein